MAKTRVKTRSAKAATTLTGDPARTIIYVHGVGNKPEESVLRCQWDHALMSFGLGERSRMAYWVQVDRHGPPKPATCAEPDAVGANALGAEGFGARAVARAVAENRPMTEVIDDIAKGEKERASLKRLLGEMDGGGSQRRAGAKRARNVGAAGFEDIDLFDPLTRLLTGLFLRDVNDFFFDAPRRDRMKSIVRERLEAGNGPFVVIGHSQGSMIAYSVLQELGAKADVALFVTLGSPLGLAEVRDQIRKMNGLGKGALPTPAGVRAWVNVFDPIDVVSQRERLSKHYRGDVVPVDHELRNPDSPKDAHSATGYLRLPTVQLNVRSSVDLERFQRLAPFMIASDVATDFERAARGVRRPLLIELTDPVWAQNKLSAEGTVAATSRERSTGKDGKWLPDTRAAMADCVVDLVQSVTKLAASDPELGVQRLERYVSVKLTEHEAQRLASSEELKRLGMALPPLYRVWRNAKKMALLDTSIHQVQASPAHQAYDATGRGIRWAVLDSGCTEHPHFTRHRTIEARWDCTKLSDRPVKDDEGAKDGAGNSTDRFGHGTHVAGIIAGVFDFPGGRRPARLSGIAPEAKLHIYKVLDDEGQGDDAWIIKALDHIASVNEKAGALEIAGVNLSLGGEFEQGVFGCGHTPLCDELRRLWRQGVLVVIAAGNEGFRRIMSSDGFFGANVPCSIGDPANLEEAIAVGAVHKEKPHTFGVSHFSSRGPTADGRNKPDCVAPGEQILSCRHDPRKPRRGQKVKTSDLYYRLDGTSMAAPHVSGLLACFLSRKREFIGQPDRVKRILLENCTDLGRDRALQGVGMPNLVKMLVQT
jgi:subtilisin family serine protease